MSNVCCKKFTGWCKSFTKTEVFLCVLQATFLVVCIGFMTFLILHLVVCVDNNQRQVLLFSQTGLNSTQTENINNTHKNQKQYASTIISITDTNEIHSEHVTDYNKIMTHDVTKKVTITNESVIPTSASTLDKKVKCTWKPSQKTEALVHYYENGKTQTLTTMVDKGVVENQDTQVTEDYTHSHDVDEIAYVDDLHFQLEDMKSLKASSDGRELFDSRKDFILALVKIKPPQDITFGCTLTVVTEYWTLTAASCIEAIEEVDSVDSFVMMQGLKEEKQNIHPLADVMIHPQYEGVNLTYDLAALKSETPLAKVGGSVVTLPSMIDYFLTTIGESLTILGYGRFRNIDKDPLTRSIREVSVHSVPLAQCPAGPGTWAPRHLAGGAPLPHGACGTAPLCAGVLHARTSPCNYCSGTPLLTDGVLLGVMSDNQHCGLSCEPALFVNLALVRDWLDSVLLK